MRRALILGFALLIGLVPTASAANIVAGAELDPSHSSAVSVWGWVGNNSQSGHFAIVQSSVGDTSTLTGSVRVATGDVNGDGVPDVVAGSGPGGGPNVRVFDGLTGLTIRSFAAFEPAFTGGVYVATGDLNGDGIPDIVVGAGTGGGPQVKVFDGLTGQTIRSFFAYDGGFTGGVRVAAGDVNGDGRIDIVTGSGPGGGPHVKVFDGKTGETIRSFFAFSQVFTGGVNVAAGDVNGDGRADLVAGADAGGGPQVSVFDGRSLQPLNSFLAYAPTFTGGVRVAVGDVDGDGRADIVTGAGAGGGPQVKAFDGTTATPFASFFAFSAGTPGGVFVAGGPKGATDQIPDLHGLVTSFQLDKGLNAYFQNKIADVQTTLGKGQSACPNMLIGLLLPAVQKAGKARGMLHYAEAQALAAATNGILIGLDCIPPTSTEPLVVNELIGLLDVVDSARVSPGETNALIGLLRKAGAASVVGSPCKALGDVVTRLVADSGRSQLSSLIGLLLPAVQKVQRDAGCLAGGS